MSNQRIFSRLSSLGKWAEVPDKANEVEVKKKFAKSGLSISHWMNDFQSSFVPPPPRPPFLDQELVTDGLTTCDLCGWAWSEKNFYSIEGHHAENSNEFIWIILLLVVSFCSAFVGAVIALKYRRSNSVRAFGPRGVGKNKEELCNEQKHQQNEMLSTSNVDLNYFMEDSQNDEAFYATLDDQDSINSDNMTTYPKSNNTKSDENDMPMFSSAPSSAYYSDLSNPPEKQYECIDNFATFDKSDYSKSSGIGSTFITLTNNNRLSAISENNFSGHNRDVNSDYV